MSRPIANCCLLYAVLCSPLCTSVGAAQERPVIADPRIEDAIEGELWEARAVDANDVDVDVTQGVVTLTGTVDNIMAKERAVRVARMTRGVLSVVDRMTVRDSGRSDAAVELDLQRAFVTDPATDSWEIATTVENGAVTITGTVQSPAEKRLADRVAKSVAGVRSVDNRLTVAAAGTRTDSELELEIAERLQWDVRLDDGLLDVDVNDGQVTLTGSVGSDFERDLALALAWVPGVTGVDVSGVEVEWWLREEMQRATAWADLGDDDIRSSIERALALDPRVSSFDVQTEVENGAATLSGVVDNLKAKRAAAQAAANTVGVLRVRNYLKVRPLTFQLNDEIAAEAEAALARDPLVTSDITVAVAGGDAMLYGIVSSAFERAHAEDVVTRIEGVTDVHNFLELPYEGPRFSYRYDDWDPLLYDYDFDHGELALRTDREIEEDIERELFWSPYVDADEVAVSVEDGVATLRGVVDGWHEWRKAAENAREGGAYRVHNDLSLSE
jgi:osmotically-inducible protein OsmY